jgi:hypothetical protein
MLTAGNRPDDHQRLGPIGNCIRQRRIWQTMRDILTAGKETDQRPPLLRDVVPHGSAQHWVASFESVENRPLRRAAVYFEFNFAVNARECAQMRWEYYTNHISNSKSEARKKSEIARRKIVNHCVSALLAVLII